MSEKVIWDFFYGKIGNPYGVAALMGNLYVESHLKANDLQGSYERKLGMTDEEYTQAVDNGSYPSDKFIRDSAGYGLAQWTYWSRKKSLYDFAKQSGKSIGDLEMQLNFLWGEIQSYKTVVEEMKNGKSVREVSDVICKRYLKPAHQEEGYLQNRANYGQSYFNKYGKVETKVETKENVVETKEKVVESKPVNVQPAATSTSGKKIVAKMNVNIRTGNGKNFERVGTLKEGASVPWIATSENGWHAFLHGKHVRWVSGEFAEVK